MAIYTEADTSHNGHVEAFPVLRRHKGQDNEGLGPVVVLFTAPERGVALSGVPDARIGHEEHWLDVNNALWVRCGISIEAKD